ncbi:NAD-dependent epimerase/dehydratase family protein [bacterium]|nr:NAD-dependent epimerase/dehydratase family protein [bacterium]
MKCLILGGAGFLGSHLTDGLLREGYSVRVFDRPNIAKHRHFEKDEKIEWFEGDFSNQEDLTEAIEDCKIIFHLISTTLPKSSNDNPIYDVETNLIGTLRLLELAKTNKIKKIIYASSGGTVYGIPKEIPIKEAHTTEPICSYGITKLNIEKYLSLYHFLYGLDFCVLRIANPFGEWQRPTTSQGAVTIFLNKALKNEIIEIWGDGTVIRDFIYVGDVTKAFLKAISYNGTEKIFNIGAGYGKSLNEIIFEIENLLGRSVSYKYLKKRSFDVPSNVLNIEKARDELVWQPETPFVNGLARSLDWLEKINSEKF